MQKMTMPKGSLGAKEPAKASAKDAGNIKSTPMPADPWQAGSDARTLAEAEGIKGDRSRHSAAKKHAKGEAKKMMAVATGGGATKPPSALGKAGYPFPQPKGGVNPKASTAKVVVASQGMGKPVAKRTRK